MDGELSQRWYGGFGLVAGGALRAELPRLIFSLVLLLALFQLASKVEESSFVLPPQGDGLARENELASQLPRLESVRVRFRAAEVTVFPMAWCTLGQGC